MKSTKPLLLAIIIGSCCAQAQTNPGLRAWQDQQGRSISATLIKVEGSNVVLQLENGTRATVPLSRFSAADQAFAKQQGSAPASAAGAPAVPKALVWPETVTVNAKDLQITTGEQDPAQRRFVYQSGSFQFVAQAPLTGTVMREIAADFELTRTLIRRLPWGWEPKPRNGKPWFVAQLFETEKDFIAGGGSENSSGGSKDDYIFTKFSALGLKKVGERYAFDAKLAEGGDMIALITRLFMTDMRGLTRPWASLGLEQFLEHVAYRNGSYVFNEPDRALKVRLEYRRSGGYETNVDRMITRFKGGEPLYTTTELRIQGLMDDLLLFYYFGYLDDEGKGARLHHYFSSVAKDSMEYREYNESGRKTRLSWRGTFAERAAELHKIMIGDRTDEQLREAIVTKYKSIGIRL